MKFIKTLKIVRINNLKKLDMDYYPIHKFNLTMQEMIAIQEKLKKNITLINLEKKPEIISGVDAVYNGNYSLCVIVTFDYKTKKILEVTYAIEKIFVKYKSGYLAFHELPSFLKAWLNLTIEPNIVVFDGYGYAHPKRFGLATHASFFIQKPTFGIAKTPFVGQFEQPATYKGCYRYIKDNDEIIGVVLRTCENRKPVFVSVGNYCTLSEAIDITLNFSPSTSRIPLLTSFPDQYSKKLKPLLTSF